MIIQNPARADGPVPHLSRGRHLVPQRYVIGWECGVVKVGETWLGHRRYGKFLGRGGIMLDLAFYAHLGESLEAEGWLQNELSGIYEPAFSDRADASDLLGGAGAGHTECFAVPPSDWPAIVELARSQ